MPLHLYCHSVCDVSLQHKRLILRPDDIFLPLLDAAATHVFQNGEASRNVFVAHEGQKVRGRVFGKV